VRPIPRDKCDFGTKIGLLLPVPRFFSPFEWSKLGFCFFLVHRGQALHRLGAGPSQKLFPDVSHSLGRRLAPALQGLYSFFSDSAAKFGGVPRPTTNLAHGSLAGRACSSPLSTNFVLCICQHRRPKTACRKFLCLLAGVPFMLRQVPPRPATTPELACPPTRDALN